MILYIIFFVCVCLEQGFHKVNCHGYSGRDAHFSYKCGF